MFKEYEEKPRSGSFNDKQMAQRARSLQSQDICADKEQSREVPNALNEIQYKVNALSKTIELIDIRTRSVQVIMPEKNCTATEMAFDTEMGVALSRIASQLQAAIERLEDLERRIQL